MPHPMNDVIVVVPGIMGSTLRRGRTPVWTPTTGGVVAALRTGFSSLRDLKLPAGLGDDDPGDGVTAVDLMPDIRLPLGVWTFDLGYTALVEFIATTFDVNADPVRGPRNLLTFPYDWRLSNRLSGERLRAFAERALGQWRGQGGAHADAQLVFLCHSMGGLVARWYVDQLGGAQDTRAVITLGTPHRGALGALDQLVNGVERGVGPFRIGLTNLARSLPSLHQLLPEYACVEAGQQLVKTTETSLPSLSHAMVRDAMHFHHQIDTGRHKTRGDYELHPIGGYEQMTLTTARLDGARAVCTHTIGGTDEGGDATVPRLSMAPPDVNPASASLHYAADNHAGLVHNRAIFDQIEGILTANPVVHRSPALRISADVPEVLDPGEPLAIVAGVTNGKAPLEVRIADPDGQPVGPPTRLLPGDGALRATPELPGPGVYRVTVQGAGSAAAQVGAITSVVTVWPRERDLGPLG